MEKFVRYSGISILAGGVFFILTNAVLTPLIGLDSSIIETAKTPVFLYRMSFAAITALLLLFGTIGLHAHQMNKSNNFGTIAFILAFFGSAFLFANEWYQIFVLPELAVNSPTALLNLDSSEGISRYDIGAMIALFTFLTGWILFAISMIKAKVYERIGPILIIAGLFITPLLSGLISPIFGTVIGNTIIGAAFCLLGRELLTSKASAN